MSIHNQNFLFRLAVHRMWEADSVFLDKLMELLHLVVCSCEQLFIFLHCLACSFRYLILLILVSTCPRYSWQNFASASPPMSSLLTCLPYFPRACSILCFSNHCLWTSSAHVYLGLPVDIFPCSHACHAQGIYNFVCNMLEPSEIWITIDI